MEARDDHELKAGEPATPVTGIVTTSLASLDVLQRAVKAGANMIVTAEPTFYSRGDARTPPAGRGRGGAAPNAAPGSAPAQPPAAVPPDPVFIGKNDFVTRHNLIVFRLTSTGGNASPIPSRRASQNRWAGLNTRRRATRGSTSCPRRHWNRSSGL